MNKEIEIIIDEEGNVTLNLKGFAGKGCITETKELEEKLGIIRVRDMKTEYNKRAVITSNETNKNRRGISR